LGGSWAAKNSTRHRFSANGSFAFQTLTTLFTLNCALKIEKMGPNTLKILDVHLKENYLRAWPEGSET
jgi:hypothetical protein